MADDALLRRAVAHARGHPFFLAALLLDWADREGLDMAGLADRLGCAPADLPRVLLCRRPTGTGPAFRADVERIAARFGLEPLRLTQAIRQATALAAMPPAAAERWLAAARDREPESEPPPEATP